jgi:hypothetical protein
MTDRNGTPRPRIIPVGGEPPPMDERPPADANGQPRGKAKGETAGPGRKSADRFGVLNRFVDFTLAGLSRAEIAVWLVLYRDTRDGTARTSMAAIARRAGCSPRQVVRAVRRLEALRLVQVVRRGGIRRGASRYHVRPLARDA